MQKLVLALTLAACGAPPNSGPDAPPAPECRLTVTGPFDDVYPCTADVAWLHADGHGVFAASSHAGRSIDIGLGWSGEPLTNHDYRGSDLDASGGISFDSGENYNGDVWIAEATENGIPGRGSYDLVLSSLGAPYPSGDGNDKHWFAHGRLTATLEPYNGSGQGSDMTLTIDF
jgi:hypothetical protein